MAKQVLRLSEILSLEVTVGNDDGYTDNILLRFEHNHGEGRVHGADEVYLTPKQLEFVGRFLVRQADELQTARAVKSGT